MRCTAQSKPASATRAPWRAPAAPRAPTAAARKASQAVVPLTGLLVAAPAAHAGEDAVDTAVSGVIEVVKVSVCRRGGGRGRACRLPDAHLIPTPFLPFQATGGALKTAVSAASSAAHAVADVYAVVKSAAVAAAPAVNSAARFAADVAEPVGKAVTPLLQSAGSEMDTLLSSQGVNPKALSAAAAQAGGAVDAAANAATGAASTLVAAGPVAVAQAAACLVAAAVLAPPLLRALATRARGYAGDVSAAAALDAAAGSGDAVLIDIRAAADKEAAGVPFLPGGGRQLDVDFGAVTDRRLRSLLRDPSAVERAVTALEVASLKRVSKGTTVLLLDRAGRDAKGVARDLAARGFNEVFVVSGGFSAWMSAKLPSRASSNVSRVEVLPALGPFGGSQRLLAGSGSQKVVSGRAARALPRGGSQKQLPGGRS